LQLFSRGLISRGEYLMDAVDKPHIACCIIGWRPKDSTGSKCYLAGGLARLKVTLCYMEIVGFAAFLNFCSQEQTLRHPNLFFSPTTLKRLKICVCVVSQVPSSCFGIANHSCGDPKRCSDLEAELCYFIQL